MAWLRWSPDSTTVYTRNREGEIATFLEVASGKALHTVTTSRVGDDVAWSPDGKLLAIGANSPNDRGKMRIWEADSGKFLRVFSEPFPFSGGPLDWSPDGKTLAWCNGPEVILLGAQTGQHDRALKGSEANLGAVLWSPDGKKLATSGQDAKVRVWDTATAREITALPTPAVPNHALAWSPDGQLLATGGPTVKVWDANTGQEAPTKIAGHNGRWLPAVAWSPDGKVLASGCVQGEIRLWDAKTGGLIKNFKGHEGQIHALTWLADSKTLVSLGEKDGTVRFWPTEEDRPPRVTQGLSSKGRFSPDHKFLVSRFDPLRLRVWETETGRLRGTLLHLQGRPEQYLAISADGHYRVSAEGWRHVVYVVQTEAGQETLGPEEFEKKYNWKNDPDKVRFVSPGANHWN